MSTKRNLIRAEREAIERERLARGLTQDALARLIGVSGPTISRWESGETRTIKPRDAAAIGRALGIRLHRHVEATS